MFAVRHALGFTKDREFKSLEELSELSESDLLWVPTDKAWHKEDSRRAMKVMRWIEDKIVFHVDLMFLFLVGPVMKLHYTLFKYAQVAPSRLNKSYIFNLCDVRVSVATRILGELTEMLVERAPWRSLEHRAGDMLSWPAAFRRQARTSTLCCWRKSGGALPRNSHTGRGN